MLDEPLVPSSSHKKVVAGSLKAGFVEVVAKATRKRNVHLLQQPQRVRKDEMNSSSSARQRKKKPSERKKMGLLRVVNGRQ